MPVTRKVRPEIMDSVALLVLDAQDAFIDYLHNKTEFLNRSAFAIEVARILKIHTLFTEQAPEKLGRTNSTLFKLARNPKVFPKRSFSALGAPGIENYLRDKEIYHLLVIGLEVPICVYQTGLQASEEDVDVTFLSDALSSRRVQDEPAVISALTRLGCQVLPSETVFYSLLADSQNSYFREFGQLVKTFNEPGFTLEDYLSKRGQPSDEDEQEEVKQRQPQVREPQPSPAPQGDTAEAGGDDRSERRSRRRGRRRRGRGGQREDSNEPRQQRPQNEERGERPAPHPDAQRQDRHERQRPDHRPDQDRRPPSETPSQDSSERPVERERSIDETTQPARDAPAPAEESGPAARKTDARKPARKTPKKAAKKAAKKSARKTARKSAKKAAAATDSTPPSEDMPGA